MNSFRQEDLPGAHEDLCAAFRLQADILIVFPLSLSTLPLMTATWKLLIPQSLFSGLNFRLISVVNQWGNGWWGEVGEETMAQGWEAGRRWSRHRATGRPWPQLAEAWPELPESQSGT